MATAALQKRGKSRWALTAPKPLAYLQLDANYEHVLAWARRTYPKKDDIRHLQYFADPRGDIKAANMRVFERLLQDYDYCIKNFRSVVIDTTSELMDVRKIAEWGRITQIPQIYYGSIYADFRWMVQTAMQSDCNVVFVHRLGDKWLNGEKTGDYELMGWKGVIYDTQVYVEHARSDENTFQTNIIECAQDANLMGMSLNSEDDENDFAGLATRIFPDSERKGWV